MDVHQTILRAFEKREGLHGRSDTDCYRLFNLEGDGLPGLSIDRYGQYLLVQAGGLKLLQLGQQGRLAGLQLGLELRRFLGQLLLSRRLLVALDVGVVHAR